MFYFKNFEIDSIKTQLETSFDRTSIHLSTIGRASRYFLFFHSVSILPCYFFISGLEKDYK